MKWMYQLFLTTCLGAVCPALFAVDAPKNAGGSGLSDSELVAIQRGYEKRLENQAVENAHFGNIPSIESRPEPRKTKK